MFGFSLFSCFLDSSSSFVCFDFESEIACATPLVILFSFCHLWGVSVVGSIICHFVYVGIRIESSLVT